MDKKIKIARWVVAAAMLTMPFATFAVTIVPPDVTTTGNPITLQDVENIITRVANFLMVIAIIIAVIFIIWGGIKYMTSRGDAKAAGEAKGIIINGIIGAAVVLGVGVILNTVRSLLARTFFS
ncbi:MAG TPA: hypothetical protein VJH71_01385 [Candidatus Paceibacterota bacterium]